MDIQEIAKICHEVNRGLCIALGDDSQKLWGGAPEWQRESAIDGVKGVQAGNFSPQESHRRWCQEKIRNGWVLGAVKDEDAKTHPCLVLYDDLPLEQQLKDHLFVTTARVLLDAP